MFNNSESLDFNSILENRSLTPILETNKKIISFLISNSEQDNNKKLFLSNTFNDNKNSFKKILKFPRCSEKNLKTNSLYVKKTTKSLNNSIIQNFINDKECNNTIKESLVINKKDFVNSFENLEQSFNDIDESFVKIENCKNHSFLKDEESKNSFINISNDSDEKKKDSLNKKQEMVLNYHFPSVSSDLINKNTKIKEYKSFFKKPLNLLNAENELKFYYNDNSKRKISEISPKINDNSYISNSFSNTLKEKKIKKKLNNINKQEKFKPIKYNNNGFNHQIKIENIYFEKEVPYKNLNKFGLIKYHSYQYNKPKTNYRKSQTDFNSNNSKENKQEKIYIQNITKKSNLKRKIYNQSKRKLKNISKSIFSSFNKIKSIDKIKISSTEKMNLTRTPSQNINNIYKQQKLLNLVKNHEKSNTSKSRKQTINSKFLPFSLESSHKELTNSNNDSNEILNKQVFLNKNSLNNIINKTLFKKKNYNFDNEYYQSELESKKNKEFDITSELTYKNSNQRHKRLFKNNKNSFSLSIKTNNFNLKKSKKKLKNNIKNFFFNKEKFCFKNLNIEKIPKSKALKKFCDISKRKNINHKKAHSVYQFSNYNSPRKIKNNKLTKPKLFKLNFNYFNKNKSLNIHRKSLSSSNYTKNSIKINNSFVKSSFYNKKNKLQRSVTPDIKTNNYFCDNTNKYEYNNINTPIKIENFEMKNFINNNQINNFFIIPSLGNPSEQKFKSNYQENIDTYQKKDSGSNKCLFQSIEIPNKIINFVNKSDSLILDESDSNIFFNKNSTPGTNVCYKLTEDSNLNTLKSSFISRSVKSKINNNIKKEFKQKLNKIKSKRQIQIKKTSNKLNKKDLKKKYKKIYSKIKSTSIHKNNFVVINAENKINLNKEKKVNDKVSSKESLNELFNRKKSFKRKTSLEIIFQTKSSNEEQKELIKFSKDSEIIKNITLLEKKISNNYKLSEPLFNKKNKSSNITEYSFDNPCKTFLKKNSFLYQKDLSNKIDSCNIKKIYSHSHSHNKLFLITKQKSESSKNKSVKKFNFSNKIFSSASIRDDSNRKANKSTLLHLKKLNKNQSTIKLKKFKKCSFILKNKKKLKLEKQKNNHNLKKHFQNGKLKPQNSTSLMMNMKEIKNEKETFKTNTDN